MIAGRRLLTEDDYHTEKTRRILATTFKCDDVFELTIDEIQVLIFNKALTSLALVKCYVQRIADYSNPATFNKTKVKTANTFPSLSLLLSFEVDSNHCLLPFISQFPFIFCPPMSLKLCVAASSPLSHTPILKPLISELMFSFLCHDLCPSDYALSHCALTERCIWYHLVCLPKED